MNKATICLNCSNTVHNNFCGQCGQSVRTERINLSVLTEELQHYFLHMHKGLLYTIGALLMRPAGTIREYISGKRRKYLSPPQCLFIPAAFYSLAVYFFGVYPDSEIRNLQPGVHGSVAVYELFYDYYSLWLLLSLPFAALSSYLFFRKSGYNYMEHLTLYAYITGTEIFILLCLYPVFYFTHSASVYIAGNVVMFLYNVTVLALLLKNTSLLWANVKALLSILLALAVLSGAIAVSLLAYYGMI